jgi:hypothetical protein
VLELTLTSPPTAFGATHWSARLRAAALAAEGTPISHATIAGIWQRFGVQPKRAQTFKFSTDPQLKAGRHAPSCSSSTYANSLHRSGRPRHWVPATPAHTSTAGRQGQDTP